MLNLKIVSHYFMYIYKQSLVVLLIISINSSSRSFSLMQIKINNFEKITYKWLSCSLTLRLYYDHNQTYLGMCHTG